MSALIQFIIVFNKYMLLQMTVIYQYCIWADVVHAISTVTTLQSSAAKSKLVILLIFTTFCTIIRSHVSVSQ